MSERFRWPLVVIPSAILMACLLAVDADGPIRALPAVWFLFFCPGLSFVWLLPMRSPTEDLAVGFVLSIVIDTLVATALLLVGGLGAGSGLIVLSLLCLVGCAMPLFRPAPDAWSRP